MGTGFVYRIGASKSLRVYIGQTKNDPPKIRLWEHKKLAKACVHPNPLLARFILKHIADLSFISWAVVDMDRSECWHISEHRKRGFVVMNLKEGGSNGSHTLQTKIKIGNANRGRVLSAEHKAKISTQMRGKVLSAETRGKMSARLKANPPAHLKSEAAKGRASQASKGNPELKKGHETQSRLAAERKLSSQDHPRGELS
jgi:hypothetical protein